MEPADNKAHSVLVPNFGALYLKGTKRIFQRKWTLFLVLICMATAFYITIMELLVHNYDPSDIQKVSVSHGQRFIIYTR